MAYIHIDMTVPPSCMGAIWSDPRSAGKAYLALLRDVWQEELIELILSHEVDFSLRLDEQKLGVACYVKEARDPTEEADILAYIASNATPPEQVFRLFPFTRDAQPYLLH